MQMIASYSTYLQIKLGCNLHLFFMEGGTSRPFSPYLLAEWLILGPLAERNSIYGGVIGTCDYGKSLLGTCVICRSPFVNARQLFRFGFLFLVLFEWRL